MVYRRKKNSTADSSLPEVDLSGVKEPCPLILVGAGTILSELIDLLKEIENYRLIGVIDPNPALRGQFVGPIPILGWLADIPRHVTHAVIGTPSTPKAFDREAVFRWLVRQGLFFPILVSPSSRCAPDLTLRRGDVLLAGCVIEAGAQLGENCLVGVNAVIERCAGVPDHQAVAPNSRVSRHKPQELEISRPKTLGATLASENDSIQDILQHINRANMEIVLVVNAKGALIGAITDGDIRRGILAGIQLDQPVSLEPRPGGICKLSLNGCLLDGLLDYRLLIHPCDPSAQVRLAGSFGHDDVVEWSRGCARQIRSHRRCRRHCKRPPQHH